MANKGEKVIHGNTRVRKALERAMSLTLTDIEEIPLRKTLLKEIVNVMEILDGKRNHISRTSR